MIRIFLSFTVSRCVCEIGFSWIHLHLWDVKVSVSSGDFLLAVLHQPSLNPKSINALSRCMYIAVDQDCVSNVGVLGDFARNKLVRKSNHRSEVLAHLSVFKFPAGSRWLPAANLCWCLCYIFLSFFFFFLDIQLLFSDGILLSCVFI